MRFACLVFSMLALLTIKAQTSHVIQRGETFELIAKRYGVSLDMIKEANPLVDECYTGITLSIPPKPIPVTTFVESEPKYYQNADKKVLNEIESPNTFVYQTIPTWGEHFNPFLSYYNPYWNDEQIMWNTRHAQLYLDANSFWNQMTQSIRYEPNYSWDSYNNYKYEPSYSWDGFVPGIDYGAMPIPVLNNTSMDTNISTSGSNGYTPRTPQTCGTCDGRGWIPETKGVASFGLADKWCSECNSKVAANHYHATCPSCKGKRVL